MNPRYVNYARVNGNNPEEQEYKDALQFKGGVMTGFIEFIHTHIAIFKKESPDSFVAGGLSDHKAFDLYLDNLPINPTLTT